MRSAGDAGYHEVLPGSACCAHHGVKSEGLSGAGVESRPARRGKLFDEEERQRGVALIARMAAGDEGALREFYDIYSSTLYGIAMRMMRNEPEAEDVVQDAFIHMWRKAGAFKGQLGSPFSWAVMIVRHKGIDRIRARQRVERTVERVKEEYGDAWDIDDASESEPVFREQRAIVRAALWRLPEEQRAALDMAFFSGLTHEEIAANTGTPLGTIKARIRRGMGRMRELVMEAR